MNIKNEKIIRKMFSNSARLVHETLTNFNMSDDFLHKIPRVAMRIKDNLQ